MSPPSGNKTSPNYGFIDVWVLKLDASGEKVWETSVGGSGYDSPRSLLLLPGGDFVVGGFMQACTDRGNRSFGGWGKNNDMGLLKFSARGELLWDKYFFGGTNGAGCFHLAPAFDEGFLAVGRVDVENPSENGSGWILRGDGLGNRLWERFLADGERAGLKTAQLLSDGGWLVGGEFWRGAVASRNPHDYGDGDYWLVRLDNNGNKLFETTFGGSKRDHLKSICPGSDGGFVLAGDSCSTAEGNKITTNYGSWDYWVIKLPPLPDGRPITRSKSPPGTSVPVN